MRIFDLRTPPVRPGKPSDLARRSPVGLGKDGIETAQAAKACAHGYFGHRQVGEVEQALGALNSRRLCQLDRGRIQMAGEEPGEVASPDPEPLRQAVDRGVVFVERTL